MRDSKVVPFNGKKQTSTTPPETPTQAPPCDIDQHALMLEAEICELSEALESYRVDTTTLTRELNFYRCTLEKLTQRDGYSIDELYRDAHHKVDLINRGAREIKIRLQMVKAERDQLISTNHILAAENASLRQIMRHSPLI